MNIILHTSNQLITKSKLITYFFVLFFQLNLLAQADSIIFMNHEQFENYAREQTKLIRINNQKEQTFRNVFYNCYDIKDSLFFGKDTILVYDEFKPKDTIQVIRYFEAGKKILAERYDSLNNLIEMAEFNGLEKNGWHKMWYPSGSLEYYTYYKNGVQVLPDLYFYEDGSLNAISELKTIHGNITFKSYYPNGILKILDIIDDSCELRQSTFQYYDNGVLKETENKCGNTTLVVGYYRNGQLAYKYSKEFLTALGFMQQWHRNGTKKIEGNIVMGGPSIVSRQLDGEWLYWNDKGKLKWKAIFKNGILVKERRYGKIDTSEIMKCIFPYNCLWD
jgi:antitoxin component YwqK of YwqJK toxin-antitoxin module